MSFFENLFKENLNKTLGPVVEEINALEPEFEKKTQVELRALTSEWKEGLAAMEEKENSREEEEA
jgi:preprotein translocase subunit SecA